MQLHVSIILLVAVATPEADMTLAFYLNFVKFT
jgi:hypothetical protein